MYKLLLADDERETRSALSRYYPWGKIGFEIVGQVDNGRAALMFLENNEVDVILCDIRMPVLDGISVARTLYQQRAKVKIVFISGYRDFGYVQQALQYGVRNYILKPTKYDVITDVFTKLKQELDEEVVDAAAIEGTEAQYGAFLDSLLSYIKSALPTVTLDSVSQRAQMHPAYFSRYFKKMTGSNFSDYLADLRMKKAVELLKEDLKVNEIAARVGYNSPKAFSRAFSSYYGCPPSEYRGERGR